MISEGSHDTEDWSNDAENLAFHRNTYDILKYFNRKYFTILLLLLYFFIK